MVRRSCLSNSYLKEENYALKQTFGQIVARYKGRAE